MERLWTEEQNVDLKRRIVKAVNDWLDEVDPDHTTIANAGLRAVLTVRPVLVGNWINVSFDLNTKTGETRLTS